MSISPEELLVRLKQLHGDMIGVCEHTDDIGDKDIFIASDKAAGHIPAALDKGALAIVCNKDIPGIDKYRGNEKVYEVDDLRQFSLSLVKSVYGNDVAHVKLIGITGTNGKTSTAHFACQLFELLGEQAGYLGTLGYGVVSAGLSSSRNTTPDFVTLYRYISLLCQQGCSLVVMEVSSHSLALNRIEGLSFSVGMFTNLSRDHLDFHGDMDAYEQAKLSFFTDYDIDQWVVNSDYASGRKLIEKALTDENRVVTSYGRSDINRKNHCYYSFTGNDDSGLHVVEIVAAREQLVLKVSVDGRFNLENLVAAVLICHVTGYQLGDVVNAAVSVKPVPGRMECIEDSRGVKVCVDYAHTPAGIEAVMDDRMLHVQGTGKVWSVFGCGGDRDRGKRPMMGTVVAKYSDRIVITDDNVRGDQAEAIICDVLSGIDDKSGVTVCRDRNKAIENVTNLAIRNDLVLLLGKGNESTITYGGNQLSHSDMAAVMHHVGRS